MNAVVRFPKLKEWKLGSVALPAQCNSSLIHLLHALKGLMRGTVTACPMFCLGLRDGTRGTSFES